MQIIFLGFLALAFSGSSKKSSKDEWRSTSAEEIRHNPQRLQDPQEDQGEFENPQILEDGNRQSSRRSYGENTRESSQRVSRLFLEKENFNQEEENETNADPRNEGSNAPNENEHESNDEEKPKSKEKDVLTSEPMTLSSTGSAPNEDEYKSNVGEKPKSKEMDVLPSELMTSFSTGDAPNEDEHKSSDEKKPELQEINELASEPVTSSSTNADQQNDDDAFEKTETSIDEVPAAAEQEIFANPSNDDGTPKKEDEPESISENVHECIPASNPETLSSTEQEKPKDLDQIDADETSEIRNGTPKNEDGLELISENVHEYVPASNPETLSSTEPEQPKNPEKIDADETSEIRNLPDIVEGSNTLDEEMPTNEQSELPNPDNTIPEDSAKLVRSVSTIAHTASSTSSDGLVRSPSSPAILTGVTALKHKVITIKESVQKNLDGMNCSRRNKKDNNGLIADSSQEVNENA